jgi:RNase adaptor protein for sRNA GlmZ degradation
VITRPTAQQLLDDCARELRESVLPQITDAATKVKLEMMEQIISSCAIRAGHELAWMAEECDAMEAYVTDVRVAFDDAEGAAVGALLTRYHNERRGGLVTEDRTHDYDLAGRAFSAALALAMRREDAELTARARTIIDARNEREGELRPNFSFPGRS